MPYPESPTQTMVVCHMVRHRMMVVGITYTALPSTWHGPLEHLYLSRCSSYRALTLLRACAEDLAKTQRFCDQVLTFIP